MKGICLLMFILFAFDLSAQSDAERYRLIFYNTENLFYPTNDSITDDDNFTPSGLFHWTHERYNRKISDIVKVIAHSGGWDMPALVGLAEVESDDVLYDIVMSPGMDDYNFIHKDSPDERGIDVALLYRKSLIKPLHWDFLAVNFPFDHSDKTRDILHAEMCISEKDTMHLFVNHWPSKYGGTAAEKKREYAASVLKRYIDSLYCDNKDVKIIIMGDFNDNPYDRSVHTVLDASTDVKANLGCLFNLSALWSLRYRGSYKYKGRWEMPDQIIVSRSLLCRTNTLYTYKSDSGIISYSFLEEKDKNNTGIKPRRTYIGPVYKGGVSDHLPVFIDLYQKNR